MAKDKDHKDDRSGKEALSAPAASKAEKPGLKRKDYESRLRELHVKLVELQEWVRHEAKKICIVFEGRDGAGKGGAIKAITARVSPRVFRVVALPAPTEREKSQMYIQRYLPHLPAGGEIVIFDRSWYNRAGVERVMGFCTRRGSQALSQHCPASGKAMVDSGIILLKYWLEVSPEEQEMRLKARIDDGRKTWKLSQDGFEVVCAMGRLHARARRDVHGDGYGVGTLVRRAIGRQAAGAVEHHRASAREHSLRARAAGEGEAARHGMSRRPIERPRMPLKLIAEVTLRSAASRRWAVER